jgi:glycosyltransferase involved in cell wall biosynthesis
MALAQTGLTVEVIVVDNGSTAANAELLAQIIDPRAKLITEPSPIGVSLARNIGAELASSDWVAFFDDDDFWASYKLRMQLDALAMAPDAKWCIGGTVCVDPQMRPVISTRMPAQGIPLDEELLQHNVVSMSDLVVRRDMIFAWGAFDGALTRFEDWDFVIRLAQQAPCPAVVDRPLSLYLLNAGSATDEIEPMTIALETFATLHESLRRERGVELDWRAPTFWLAFRLGREGRGADAASVYRQSFGHTHDPRDLVYSIASRWFNRTFVRVLSRIYLSRQPREWRRNIRELRDDVASHQSQW